MHKRIIGLYEDNAAHWDALRSHGLSPPETPHIDAFAAALPAGGRVLDIGCGSGRPVAARLIERGLRVTGIDSAPSLIALCRARFPHETWQVADMRSLALGRRFAGLIAWHSFFHLHPDAQRAMFPIFAAHAEPGALLAFTSGDAAGVRIGTWQGESLYHASLAPEDYHDLLSASGFMGVNCAPGEPPDVGPTVWTARFRT